jgi:hypothetical protein
MKNAVFWTIIPSSSSQEILTLCYRAQPLNAVHVRVEAFTAVTMKNAVFWNVTPCDSCENRVSQGLVASIFRVKGIRDLVTASTKP